MRTSSQLNKNGACERNIHTSLQGVSRTQILASAQKNVLMRILKGETIPDISGEIDSILKEQNFLWENTEQRLENEKKYELRIQRFLESEQSVHKIFPDGLDTTVDYFGEQIEAKPDYFIEEPNGSVRVCKVTTSAFMNEKDDLDRMEMYALGLCGKKLFPGRDIFVTRYHLRPRSIGEKEAYRRNTDGTFVNAYDSGYSMSNKCTSTMEMTPPTEAVYADIHQNEGTTTCSPEECAGCAQYNVCHYEPAPVSADIEAAVKPVSEIRLSNEQQRVIDFENGKARVNAGPGGGKTLVVALRIANLLAKGYNPEDFCLLTYTNAGAEEMTARVMSYAAANGVPLDPEKFASGTINSFCQNIIVNHYAELGYVDAPRILPEEKKKHIINALIDKYPKITGWDNGQMSDSRFAKGKYTKSALTMASRLFAIIKKKELTADIVRGRGNDCPYEFYGYTDNDINTIFAAYNDFQSQLKAQNLLEFDDQLILVNKLYSMHPSLFEEMGFKHIMVDEFQDTDLPQIKLLQKMIDTTTFKSFMAVGDDAQAIFGFRDTSPEFMINFEQYFGHFTDFALVENHRSTKNIVDFANAVNDKSDFKVDKNLIATKPEGAAPTIQGYYSEKQEYDSIAQDIKRRWDNGERDIAVLMSERTELRKIAGALAKLDVPSVLMCRIPFTENSRVAALQTFYDSFSGKGTQGFADYQNVLLNGTLAGASAEDIDTVVTNMQDSINASDKGLSSFKAFANALDPDKTDPCYQEFLEKINFCKDSDELDEFWQEFRVYGQSSEFKREGKYEGVCLNTIHSAKGLEWDTTYLSLSKLDKPSLHTKNNTKDNDETIRKFFVGSTRARENLIMSGQYVLKMDKSGAVFNNYVKMAYDLMGKPYGYTFTEYRAVKAQEKAEAQEAATRTITPTMRHRPSADVQAAITAHHNRHPAQTKAQPQPTPEIDVS